MISVQYNREADRAYEKELRKQREHLIANQEQIYQNLEEYLEQQDWKKADYETAFIMYQWMIIEGYDDFYQLFRRVSLEVIDEIDRLWVKYSEGKFGIKRQAKIYRDLGGTEEYNEEVWNSFGDRVGWKKGGRWYKANNLPILMYYVSPIFWCMVKGGGDYVLGSGVSDFWDGFVLSSLRYFSSLASRLKGL